MKMKCFLIGMTLVMAVAAVWIGRAVYRVRHNLVTLDVYNAPLATVIRQIERQTREKVVAPKGFDSKVTLTVKNVPLEEALDQLGQQIGANWSKWHAVYESDRALGKLESALRDRAKIEESGWTNVAPQLPPGAGGLWVAGNAPAGMVTADNDVLVSTTAKPRSIRLNKGDIKDGNVEAAVREQLKAAGVDEAVVNQAGAAARQATLDVDVQATGGGGSNGVVKAGGHRPMIRMVTRTREGNGAVTEEIWSPEHVVLEGRLRPKLGDGDFAEASEAVAHQVAEKVKGSLTTLYVLRAAPGGLPFGGSIVRKIRQGSVANTNAAPGQPPPLPDIEAAVRRAEAENYTRLTPEQRVQRAREKQAVKTNP